MNHQLFKFARTLKLSPALGDWTSIKYDIPNLDEVNIKEVQRTSFDCLPVNQLKKMHFLHYRVLEKICQHLSQSLDLKIEFHTLGATQLGYEELLRHFSNPIVQSKFALEKIGYVYVFSDWEMTEILINRLLGGEGIPEKLNQLSDVQLEILKSQFDIILTLLKQAWHWSGESEMQLSAGALKRDARIGERDTYVLFMATISTGQSITYPLTFAYPTKSLRQLIEHKNAQPDPIKHRVHLNIGTLNKVKVDVVATLGESTLTMKEIRNLQLGDVITLNRALDEPVTLKIGDKVTSIGQPGINDDHLAIQILGIDQPSSRSNTPVPIAQKPKAKNQEIQKNEERQPISQAVETASVVPQAPETAHVADSVSDMAMDADDFETIDDDSQDHFESQDLEMDTEDPQEMESDIFANQNPEQPRKTNATKDSSDEFSWDDFDDDF